MKNIHSLSCLGFKCTLESGEKKPAINAKPRTWLSQATAKDKKKNIISTTTTPTKSNFQQHEDVGGYVQLFVAREGVQIAFKSGQADVVK